MYNNSNNVSEDFSDVMAESHNTVITLAGEYVGIEHLFVSLLRVGTSAQQVLETLGVDIHHIRKDIEYKIQKRTTLQTQKRSSKDVYTSKKVEDIIHGAFSETISLGHEKTNSYHLLLSIMKDGTNFVCEVLERKHINYKKLKTMSENQNTATLGNNAISYDDTIHNIPTNSTDSPDSGRPYYKSGNNSSKDNTKSTPVLDSFSRDLTVLAREGAIDPIVGRKSEIERVSQILSRRKKNNPILIGEPGVGKSSIAEGLALRIINKKVPRILFDKRVVMLDIMSLISGTKYRGEFEERTKKILDELSKSRNIILFIDEIHTMVGAGSASGSLDASNMFKPALAKGDIQCIGATTLNEYRQHIEKDGALERRFQKVMIDPTSVEDTIHILNNIKEKYEDHHSVRYTEKAIEACVKLTNRYLLDRFLPDKAIDALDEAGSRIHIGNMQAPSDMLQLEEKKESLEKQKEDAIGKGQYTEAATFRDELVEVNKRYEHIKEEWLSELKKNKKLVDVEHIEEVISMMSGIPVNKISEQESGRLVKMESEISEQIIGQNEAVKKIVKAIQRSRSGLKNPNKPISSFIFLGPTGVGKTQITKVLSDYLFDSQENLVRIDMSEYMEKFSVTRLIGAPPGYVGYEEGGQLTEKVRRKPYSVVLLDEIEKAHQDVYNLLLQILDEGFITDSLGRKIDFRNTIIIMTSNIGMRKLQDFGGGVGFNTTAKDAQKEEYIQSVIQAELKKNFSPEFLNRVDEIVVFNTLKKEDLHKIIDIEFKFIYERVKELGYNIDDIGTDIKDFLCDKGYDENFGARPLKRTIQRFIEDKLAEEIVLSNIQPGDKFTFKLDKNTITVNITKAK